MILEIRGLSFKFEKEGNYIFKDVSLNIFPGNMILLKGESGIGKSTFCKAICGVLTNEKNLSIQGSVKYNKTNILDLSLPEISKFLGVVFQESDNQLFMPTIEDEIAFGLENLAMEPSKINEILEEVIQRYGLENIRYKNPKKCSGGEKQLVVFASIVVMNRPFLILDEAFSQVDQNKRDIVRQELLNLKQKGIGILLVDHESYFDDIADDIYYLHDTRLYKTGELAYANSN